jgi:hypothetical protein
MSENIGFVGLGIMGLPMARNLADAGFELTVFNRTSSKAEEMAEGSAAGVAYSLAELAKHSDVVITMLPGPPEVEAVVAGEGGLLEFMRQRTLLVDMSTSSPVLARDLAREAAQRGIGMLDAPVSGGDVAAEQGTLSIMAGGEEEDFARAKPLFEAMGETIVHVGERGGAGNQDRKPDRGSVASGGCLRSPGAWLQSRGRVVKAHRGALRGPGGEQGHGGEARQAARPRLHAGWKGGVPPQRPRDSTRGGQGVRRDAARHGPRRPDVRRTRGQGKRRMGPLRATHPDRGAFRPSRGRGCVKGRG